LFSNILTISFCNRSFELSLTSFWNNDKNLALGPLSILEIDGFSASISPIGENGYEQIIYKQCADASRNLVSEIKNLFEICPKFFNFFLSDAFPSISGKKTFSVEDISIISFLKGPGSFTSCRIACAVALGLKAGAPNIILLPTLVNEAIHELLPGMKILMRCNSTFWHLYDGRAWKLIKESELLENPPECVISAHPISIPTGKWPNLTEGLRRKAINWLNSPKTLNQEVEPFYGFEL
jgi:hypothetical protein